MDGPQEHLLADILQGVPSNSHDGTPGERGAIGGSLMLSNTFSPCVLVLVRPMHYEVSGTDMFSNLVLICTRVMPRGTEDHNLLKTSLYVRSSCSVHTRLLTVLCDRRNRVLGSGHVRPKILRYRTVRPRRRGSSVWHVSCRGRENQWESYIRDIRRRLVYSRKERALDDSVAGIRKLAFLEIVLGEPS